MALYYEYGRYDLVEREGVFQARMHTTDGAETYESLSMNLRVSSVPFTHLRIVQLGIV